MASADDVVIWVMTPYKYAEGFFEPYRGSVTVHTAEGATEVEVVRLSDRGPGEALVVANLFERAELVDRPRRAIGYSENFSIEEAFQDAVSNLSSEPPPYPDYLATVRIEEIGALYGGIVGYTGKLFVKVVS